MASRASPSTRRHDVRAVPRYPTPAARRPPPAHVCRRSPRPAPQELEIDYVITCANEGPLPVELVLSPQVATGLVKAEDFSGRNSWSIGSELSLSLTTVGASAARRFPALRLGIHVERKPFFYLVNVRSTSVHELRSTRSYAPHPPCGCRLQCPLHSSRRSPSSLCCCP